MKLLFPSLRGLHDLRRRGGQILRRYNPRFRDQVRLFSTVMSYRDFFATNPDVVLISQGGTFDARCSPDLLEVLYVAPIPFVVVCQWNEGLPALTDDERDHCCNFFSLAFRVLFVSNQNRLDAERQLAKKIPNSALVLNPVNISDRSYLPWPVSSTARFAGRAGTGVVRSPELELGDLLKELLCDNKIVAASGMARRECYERISFFPLNMPWAGDWYLWCVFALYFDVGYFAEPMVCYRDHDLSMTEKLMQKHVEQCVVEYVEMP